MATKLGKLVTYHKELPLIKILDPSILWFFGVMWHIKYSISPLAIDQATKYRKVVTQCEEFPPINSYNHLNMCLWEVTWQIKNIISPLSQSLLWSQVLSTYRGNILQGTPTHKFAWLLNKMVVEGQVINLKRYISTCRRPMDTKLGKVMTYQWEAAIFKPTWPFYYMKDVRTCDNSKKFVSTIKRPMVSKSGRLLTYRRRFSTQTLKSSPTSCFFLKYST